jgi:hypothetical protein
MSNQLAWLCYLGGALALLFYFFVWLRRPSVVRLLNNSGLLFTGFGLGLLPMALIGRRGGEDHYVLLTIGFLWLALLAQSVAAFRERKAWDGVDRRAGDGA